MFLSSIKHGKFGEVVYFDVISFQICGLTYIGDILSQKYIAEYLHNIARNGK